MSFLQTTLSEPSHKPKKLTVLEDDTEIRWIDSGVLRVSPKAETKSPNRLIISSGVHGNETAPMEIVDAMVSDIRNGQLSVRTEVLFIIGNPEAAKNQKRFMEDNLNRLFSGKHKYFNSPESSRAKSLEDIVRDFYADDLAPGGQRLHYDLHTAIRGSELEKFAVYPYLHQQNWLASQIGFLEHCDIQAVLLSSQPSGTFSYFSSHEFGAHSFTIELGKVRKFGENDMSRFKAVDEGLRGLISANEAFSHKPKNIKIFAVVEEVFKRTDQFRLHIDDAAKNFTEFPVGSLLASDDSYEYRTRVNGERFVFPISNVPCGQRAMLVVAPTSIE